jgi:hypothetical protein
LEELRGEADPDGGNTGMESVAVAVTWVGEVLSTTCTVKLGLPCSLGVPEMTPLAERLKPAGREPAKRAHESGAVPPAAVNDARYGVPCMALGRFLVVTVSGATLTARDSVTFVVSATGAVLSVTSIVNVECPGELGMPVMVPLDVRSNPAGSTPAVVAHE